MALACWNMFVKLTWSLIHKHSSFHSKKKFYCLNVSKVFAKLFHSGVNEKKCSIGSIKVFNFKSMTFIYIYIINDFFSSPKLWLTCLPVNKHSSKTKKFLKVKLLQQKTSWILQKLLYFIVKELKKLYLNWFSLY